jgi:hypothetical protein
MRDRSRLELLDTSAASNDALGSVVGVSIGPLVDAFLGSP